MAQTVLEKRNLIFICVCVCVCVIDIAGKSLWELFLEQFDDLLVKILLIAAIISFVSIQHACILQIHIFVVASFAVRSVLQISGKVAHIQVSFMLV